MILKTCGCCKRNFTASAWARLKKLGVQPAGEEGGVTYELEMANCDCGSTIAIERISPQTLAEVAA